MRTRAAILAVGLVVAGCAGDDDVASCPDGTRYHRGACIETQLRAEAGSWREASRACVADRRRVPTLAELQTFLPEIGADPENLEWHNLRYRDGGRELAGLISASGELDFVPSTDVEESRCVAAPGE